MTIGYFSQNAYIFSVWYQSRRTGTHTSVIEIVKALVADRTEGILTWKAYFTVRNICVARSHSELRVRVVRYNTNLLEKTKLTITRSQTT